MFMFAFYVCICYPRYQPILNGLLFSVPGEGGLSTSGWKHNLYGIMVDGIVVFPYSMIFCSFWPIPKCHGESWKMVSCGAPLHNLLGSTTLSGLTLGEPLVRLIIEPGPCH